MNKSFLAILLSMLLVTAADSTFADSMRCDRNLISRGDHLAEVLSSCGEPFIANHKTIYRSGIPARRFGVVSLGNGYYSDLTGRELIQHNRSVVEVPVETWTYNFGRRYFMREVTITDGRVSRIKTLGYGH